MNNSLRVVLRVSAICGTAAASLLSVPNMMTLIFMITSKNYAELYRALSLLITGWVFIFGVVFVLVFVCLAIYYGLVKLNSGLAMKATYLLFIPSLYFVGLAAFLSLACVLEPVNAGGCGLILYMTVGACLVVLPINLWFFKVVRGFVSHRTSAKSSS